MLYVLCTVGSVSPRDVAYLPCINTNLKHVSEQFISPAVMGQRLEQSGWIMSGVLVLNQG